MRYDPSEYVLLTEWGEPKNFDEALEDQHKEEWSKTKEDEMDSLYKNHTFELVKLPKGKNGFAEQVSVQD